MFSSDQEIWDGIVHSIENARSLQNDAKLLRLKGHIGSATALMILSAEEASKAMSLGLYIRGSLSLSKVKEVFHKHQVKQNIGSRLSSTMLVATQLFKNFPNIPDDLPNEAEIIRDSKDWLLKADLLKKNGLYVGFQNNKWVLPSDTTADDYELSEHISAILLITTEWIFLKGSLIAFKGLSPPAP